MTYNCPDPTLEVLSVVDRYEGLPWSDAGFGCSFPVVVQPHFLAPLTSAKKKPAPIAR